MVQSLRQESGEVVGGKKQSNMQGADIALCRLADIIRAIRAKVAGVCAKGKDC